jgi:hypothetical protein
MDAKRSPTFLIGDLRVSGHDFVSGLQLDYAVRVY